MKLPVAVIIPARYESSRLPGKPLLRIGGKYILQHVHERAVESAVGRVVIATDDERIMQAAEDFGAEVLMTAADHRSGTERVREAALLLNLSDDTIVVNIQGDEPLLPVAVIRSLAQCLQTDRADMATVGEAIQNGADLQNPNIVKLVIAADHSALYFSRAPIPWHRENFTEQHFPAALPAGWYRHAGIYAYRVSLLKKWQDWTPCEAEQFELLEQLRPLHHGVVIRVLISPEPIPHGVDTAEQLAALRADFGEPTGD